MKRLSLAVLLSTLLLTGCVGKEPNEIAYVVALGIDSGENGNYKITIQYANPSKISGGGEESGDSEESGVENFVLEAPDIYAAVGLAERLDDKAFSLSHTKLIVVSRETSENGIKDLTELFLRNEELRPDVYLAVAEDAGEYLQNVNPATEVNPAKYYQLFFDKNKLIGLPEGIVKNFFCGAETGDYDLVLPVARSSDEENISSAVFKGGKMVGEIDEFETEVYKLLDNDYASGYLTLQNDTTLKDPVTIKIIQKKLPKYDIDTDNKTITVGLEFEGDIYAISPQYNIAADLKGFEKNCEDYISGECERLMKRVLTEYKSDIFRLNEKAKTKFMTNEDYDDYKNHIDYSDFDIKVNVNFEIRRTGLIVKEV